MYSVSDGFMVFYRELLEFIKREEFVYSGSKKSEHSYYIAM